MTHRLFIALQPSPEVRRVLLGLMGGVEGAYWQTDEQLHLTLAYIGHVDRHQSQDIMLGLERLTHPAINVETTVLGTFDSGKFSRIGSLWVGAGPAAELTSLASATRSIVRQAGAPVEVRRFLPHVTIARFPRSGVPPVNLQRFLSTTHVPRVSWCAEEVVLFESRLGSGGAHYEPIERFRFAGGGWTGDEQRFLRRA